MMLNKFKMSRRTTATTARLVAAALLAMPVAGLLFTPGASPSAHGLTQDVERLNRFIQKSKPDKPAAQAFRRGRGHIEDEDWAGAASTFDSFIAAYPADSNLDAALYWLAYALKKQERYADADARLARLIRDYPRSSWGDDARAMQLELAPLLGRRQLVENTVAGEGRDELKIIALQSLFQGNPERGMEYVAEILKPGSRASRELRESAVNLLWQHGGDRATPLLIEIVRNQTDAGIRKPAIFGLGQTNDERALDVLRELIVNPTDRELRKGAVFAVAQHRSPRARATLIELARTATDGETRQEAIFWLGQTGSEEAIDALTALYASEREADIRKKILFSLSQHRSAGAHAFLLRVARDAGGDVELRKEAIFALREGRDGERTADDLLSIYAADANVEIRKQVIFTLSELRSPRAQAKLLEIARGSDGVEERKQAIFWLSQRGVQNVETLIALYDAEKFAEVKDHLIFALAETNDKRALRKLIAIARGDASVELRKKAVFWLGQSHDPEAAKFLEDILK